MAQANVSGTRRRDRRRGILLAILGVFILILLCLVLWIIWPPPEPQLPIAVPGGPYTIGEGQPLTFDGSGSTGENITTYAWDFGDGSTGSGVSPIHTYSDGPAEFTATLTVTDSAGRTNSATTPVTVNNLPPTAEAGGPYMCFVGQTIPLAGTCSDPGPVDATSLTCTWADFSGAVLSEPNYTCPATPGEVTVTLTATDKDGASAQDSAIVTVQEPAGRPPTAVIQVFLRDKTGRIFGFNGSQSTDPDGQIVAYDWDFGDDSTGTGVEIVHEYAQKGNYTVTLTVTDNEGQTGTALVNIP